MCVYDLSWLSSFAPTCENIQNTSRSLYILCFLYFEMSPSDVPCDGWFTLTQRKRAVWAAGHTVNRKNQHLSHLDCRKGSAEALVLVQVFPYFSALEMHLQCVSLTGPAMQLSWLKGVYRGWVGQGQGWAGSGLFWDCGVLASRQQNSLEFWYRGRHRTKEIKMLRVAGTEKEKKKKYGSWRNMDILKQEIYRQCGAIKQASLGRVHHLLDHLHFCKMSRFDLVGCAYMFNSVLLSYTISLNLSV